MSDIGRAVVRVPKEVKKGEVATIRLVIIHPMETGLRKDPKTGQTIPAHYINRVEFYFNDKLFSRINNTPGISQNPYFAINFKPTESGTLKIVYEDNKGGKWEQSVQITVA